MAGGFLAKQGGATMVERLTREEARALTGPVDDVTLAEIVQLGVTRAELAEAQAWIENDEAMLNEGRGIPAGRVARVVEMLREKDEDDIAAAAPL
jgi:hypothetical protein